MIEQVLVYRLYEQDALGDRDRLLSQWLEAPGPGTAMEPVFTPLASGGFRWRDLGRLSRGGMPDLLPTSPVAARRAAVEFMRAANATAQRDRARSGRSREELPDPFAVDQLVPGASYRVRALRETSHDHWLTSWHLSLPAVPGAGRHRAPVIGGNVELRVGARGRVIGVISRARPWRSIASTAVLPWEAEADQHADDGHGDHHHGATGTASEPEVVYICDQLDEPQRFLAPCWLIPPADDRAHHSRRYWPASAHTLIPEIQLGRTGGRLVAHAVVMQSRQVRTAVPHGRDWRIRWSVATLPEFLAGERRVVESTELVLPIPGLYQLELHVEHIGTGAIRTAQRQVVARDA